MSSCQGGREGINLRRTRHSLHNKYIACCSKLERCWLAFFVCLVMQLLFMLQLASLQSNLNCLLLFNLLRTTKGHSFICIILYNQKGILVYVLFRTTKGHSRIYYCTTKGHSRICTISYNQRALLQLHYFAQPKGHSFICTILYNQRAFSYLLFRTTKGHSCILTISYNQRAFLYLLFCTTKEHSCIYSFVQPKGILVSALYRTAKGHSCISPISYNQRSSFYLYYFVQPKGILVCMPILTTRGFHIFIFMILLSDNTLSSINNFLCSNGRGGQATRGPTSSCVSDAFTYDNQPFKVIHLYYN